MYSAVVIKKFCRGDESLEDECSGQSLEVDNDQVRASSKLILLTIREVAGELNTDRSMVVQHVKQTGKVGASWADCKSKKIIFSYSMQQHCTISLLDCEVWWKVDFIQWPVTSSTVVGWRISSKVLPKAKLVPKKKGHGHCLVVCCLCHLQQFSESWWHDYIWEVCSANPQDALKTSTSTAVFYQQKEPNSSHNAWSHITQPSLEKLNELGYKFCFFLYIHLTSHKPTTTSSSIPAFWSENASITSRRQTLLSRSLSNSEEWTIILQE